MNLKYDFLNKFKSKTRFRFPKRGKSIKKPLSSLLFLVFCIAIK